FHLVGTLFDLGEGQPQSNRALRMNCWQLAGDDRIERAKDIELPVVIRGRVAQDGNLNIHDLPVCLTEMEVCPKLPRASTSERAGRILDLRNPVHLSQVLNTWFFRKDSI